jgi:hypothetical protein
VALVRNGEAVPLDDECRKAAAMTQAQIDAAVRAQFKLHQPQTTDDSEGDDDEDSD